MARFPLVLFALLAALGLGHSIPNPYIPFSPTGEGTVLLPGGPAAAGFFDGSIYGSGALAAAAADYYSSGGVAVAAGPSSNTAAAGAGYGSGSAIATNNGR